MFGDGAFWLLITDDGGINLWPIFCSWIVRLRACGSVSPIRYSLKMAKRKNPWTLLQSRAVYENPWISVREDSVLNPSKLPGIYGIVHFKNLAVGVLALANDVKGNESILLVGQYRYPLNEYCWEIPEGGCPNGEKPLTAARRELREETGFRARSWTKVLDLTLSNSTTDERAVIYVARGLTGGDADPEPTEKLTVKTVTLQKALSMVLSGEITDAISVAAILFASRQSNRKLRRAR